MNHERNIHGQMWKKIKTILLDYITFLALFLLVLINITLGRVLRHIDQVLKTRYLERLTRLFEMLA